MHPTLPTAVLLSLLAAALAACGTEGGKSAPAGGTGGGNPAPSSAGTPPASAPATPASSAPAVPPPAHTPPAAPKSEIPADVGETKTTASGLRYCVLKQGTGTVRPKMGDKIHVHYTGWLPDGTEFDSSRRRGAPADFAVGQLIEGWNEALLLMTEGSRLKITVPPALGYGAGGSPPVIPGGATLLFDMELLRIVPMPMPPVFRAPDPKAQKRTEKGVGYEVLQPTQGPCMAAGDAFEMEYSFWTAEGELLESSVLTGKNIVGRVEDLALPFFKEIPALMHEGETCLVEVPSDQGFGARGGAKLPPGSKAIWRLRLVHIAKPLAIPAFNMPAEKDLQRLPGGLGIQTLKEGTGEEPQLGEEVSVHYAGWLADGTLFDSSYTRGMPTTFRLGEVIPGWNLGLQKMKPGGEAILVIPPDMGYGARGAGGKIPPNSTLVFRVVLVEIKK